ncbi:MAG: polysaccharide biosynthesis tyrosine autokinase [Nocardioidaceae bacterium]|nr:polysaccharide biosynthesis tyrosine autokinase [Nocardioidaceae bacterium]MCL2614960.1 polysaccharide biosynthesis tyrosine autokinase [Nocardioidaceae bacterium]
MDFKQFLGVLRRRWISVVAVIAVAVAIATAISFVMTPKYESKSQLFLNIDVSNITDSYAASLYVQTEATAYAQLAQSTKIAHEVVGALNLDVTDEQLAGQISATVDSTTSLIDLTVTDTNAARAQAINKQLTTALINYIEHPDTGSGTSAGQSKIQATVTNLPTFSTSPVSPKKLLNIVAGLAIGVLLGIALAVSRELLDRTIRTADHVADITEAPVLASIGFDGDIRRAPLLTDLGGFAARTEAFRLLRTNLQFIDLDHQPRCLVITSAVPGEGKTMTSTNLAVALAQTGRRTLIIDADLRRPRVASTLGLDPAVGLTTALVGKTEIADAIQVHGPSGLHVLASGAKPPNPTEILQSRVTHDLIRRLRSSYDTVIIDGPPLLPVADASVLSTLADGVILVIRHGKTTRDQVTEAVNRVNQVGGRLYGVVVNMVAKRAVGSYYYYYYEETGPAGGKSSKEGKRRSQ